MSISLELQKKAAKNVLSNYVLEQICKKAIEQGESFYTTVELWFPQYKDILDKEILNLKDN